MGVSLLLTDYAGAAIKPGTTCTKLKSVKIVGNLKFTCVRSGKKFAWSHGEALGISNKPVSKTEKTSQSELEKTRIENEQAQKDAVSKANAEATAIAEKSKEKANATLEAATLENSTFDINHLYPRVVYERSRAEIAKAVASGGSDKVKPIFHVGQNVDPDLLKEAYVDIDDAVRLWSKYFQPEDVEIIFYSYADKDWAGAKYTALTGYPISNSPISSCNETYCGNGSAVSNFKISPIRYLYEHGLQKSGSSIWHKSTNVHEYTHLAQTFFANQNGNKMPNWILEGIAQFYGEAVSYAKFDIDKKTRSALHTNYWLSAALPYFQKEFGISDLPTILRQRNESNSVKIMEHLEYKIPPWEEFGLGYLFGGYAAEVLVSLYGHDKLVEYMQTFHDSEDFKGNFNKVYGMTTTDFYKKLTPYFADMADELKNPN